MKDKNFKWMKGLWLSLSQQILAKATWGPGTCGHSGNKDVIHPTNVYEALMCQTQF